MIHHFARALAVREQARAKTSSKALAVVQPAHAFRIRRDPSDARRAVITGRFADVCAALDRMVAELEPA